MGLFEQKRYKQKRVVQCNRLKSCNDNQDGKIKNNHNSKQEKIDTQDKRKDVKKTSFLPTSAEQSSSKPLNKGFRSLKFYVNFYVFFFALRKMHVKIS